jgi:ATP-dependent Clp protease adaptor protein ClpS
MADEDVKQDAGALEECESATATVPAQKPAPPKRDPRMLPPCKVLLHNDDVNTFDHVIRSIVRLTRLRENDAVVKVIEAHEQGLALLLVTHRERAELYLDQFASLNITITIETDEA